MIPVLTRATEEPAWNCANWRKLGQQSMPAKRLHAVRKVPTP